MFPDVVEVNFTLSVDPLRRRVLGSPETTSSFQVRLCIVHPLIFALIFDQL
jgi:hypothetical protein